MSTNDVGSVGSTLRSESDLLGAVSLPNEALYGAHTQRALTNFPIEHQRSVGDFEVLVNAIIAVKKAAAMSNRDAGLLDPVSASAIIDACDLILAGGYYGEFPVHTLQGGGGTSANMNANEVVANLANESIGGKRGEYQPIDPLRHVNLNQSTNDVIPTACHVAAWLAWPAVEDSLLEVEGVLTDCMERFGDIPRLSRTCLQDAARTTYADLLGGYLSHLTRHRLRILGSVSELRVVALGGTLVGRVNDSPEAYRNSLESNLRAATGWNALTTEGNHFDAAQNLDPLASLAAANAGLAAGLIKISKDLRLLASGPEGGFGELVLTAVQQGSSALPGKVNPVLLEHAIQICMRVSALARVPASAEEHGELDLNVWGLSAAVAVLEQFELLHGALDAFGRCVAGASANAVRSESNAEATAALLWDMQITQGYDAVEVLVKKATGDADSLRRAVMGQLPSV